MATSRATLDGRGPGSATGTDGATPEVVAADLADHVREILHRRPAVGLAVGVIHHGRLAGFHGHGLADIASRVPITEDTVFRIGSVTKTMTAIAIMQLWEEGRVDLDAPATEYLRGFRLVPARPEWRPATVRDLLTHSAGVPDVRRAFDLLSAGLTPADGRPPLLNVVFGRPLPSLADHYRDGLKIVVEPGTTFAYTNHGFAALGQIVEDVSGLPLDRYLREHVFDPLGMVDTDLVRSTGVAARLATGYRFDRRGPRPVPDRDWIGSASGGAYSSTRDMARYARALLGGGANEYGRILQPTTLATMFEPHFQPLSRVPGMGLGFFRADVDGHRVVVHDGILPGFNAELLVAPDDDLAVFAVTNGSSGAFAWLRIELERLLARLLGRSGSGGADVVHHPELWPELCGRYVLTPRIADLRERLMLGGGAEVCVRGGRLMVRVLTPLPSVYRGLPLEPGDAGDPYAFRLDLSGLGMSPVRVVFGPVVDGRATALHTDLGGQPWSLIRASEPKRSRTRLLRVGTWLAVAGAGVAIRLRARRTST
jgi:CubicO group peptidase (beta-lactamase class C family)